VGKPHSIIGPGGPPVAPAKPAKAATAAVTPRTVDLPPLSIRAELQADAVDADAREVDLVFTTGAQVQRYDWAEGSSYLEELSLDPKHVRLDRLNSGAPLLNSHSAYSVEDVIGVVVRDSATLTKKEGRARVRFSKRADVTPIWGDVQDRVLGNVSVGYRIYRYEETEGKGNRLPVRLATDWEPFEVSLVPIPADVAASVRGQKPADTNPCEIVPSHLSTRAEAPSLQPSQPKEKEVMEPINDVRAESLAEVDALTPVAEVRKPAAPVDVPTDADRGAAQERERINGILAACRAARLPQETATKLINDGVTLVRAQSFVFEELAKRSRENDGPSATPAGNSRIEVGDDPLVHARAGIENALLHRAAPNLKDSEGKQKFALSDAGRQYRSMGLMDIARALLHGRGIRTTGMSKIEMAGAALGLSQRTMHTTSDFALLLADVQGKVLRAAYDEAPQTWQALARTVILPDFKASKQLQLGDAPALQAVLEHGEFTRGTVAEAKEQFALSTYGRIFGITRQALINDDTDAFARIPLEFGRSARRKESDLAWAQITSNPTMGDSVALFDASGHANYTGSGTAISVDSLGVARKTLRLQKGLDGTTLMNLTPRYLIVPAAKETIADQYVTAITASAGSSVNPFAGRLTVISEPRLDAASGVSWYMAADPSQIDILLHGVLEGQEGPVIETRVGFDVDGIEIKARLDCAFKAADWRGLYKNAGA
jgi:hypothetical protein